MHCLHQKRQSSFGSQSLANHQVHKGGSPPGGGHPAPRHAAAESHEASPTRCTSWSPKLTAPPLAAPSHTKYLPCDASTRRSGVDSEKREKKSQSQRPKICRPPSRIHATRHTCHTPPRTASCMGRLERYEIRGSFGGGATADCAPSSRERHRFVGLHRTKPVKGGSPVRHPERLRGAGLHPERGRA